VIFIFSSSYTATYAGDSGYLPSTATGTISGLL
jgi:hypothetical protein